MPNAEGPDRKNQELLDNMWASDVDKGDLTKKDLAIAHKFYRVSWNISDTFCFELHQDLEPYPEVGQ